MSYWSYDEPLMCRMFPSSLGDVETRWFLKLSAGQIDNFRELAEQFIARFIINSRIIKGAEALTTMRKKSNETLREYFSRYWTTYQETEECDEKFAVNTCKYGLQKDKDSIYNSLTRLPPYTFDDLVSRVNEYARVEDDEMNSTGPAEEKKGNGGKFDKSKRKMREENNTISG